MRYYDTTGKLRVITEAELKHINNGQTANIYLLDQDTVFKRYFSYIGDSVIIDDEVFKLLTYLNDPHIVKLFELFKDEEQSKNSAYTMEYVSEEEVDYLDEYCDLFLEHINDIERVVDLLTTLNIRIMDLKNKNVIVKRRGLIIIDPDKYRVVDYNPAFSNKDQLLYLAYSLLNFGKSRYNDSLDRVKLLDFRKSITIDEDVSITSELAKTLKKNTKPIDIFRRAV